MAKKQASLTGKPLDQLSDDELASLSLKIETRRKSLKDALEKEHFRIFASSAKEMVEVLGLERLPKITLIPDAAGTKYEVSLAAIGVKSPGKRAKAEPNGGKITISKIGTAKGSITHFKTKTGKQYAKIQDLVKVLKQPDGKPEAERCWDISRKGISASDIVIKYHADEVTLVYQNGKEQLVKDAVEEASKTRAVA